MVHIDLGGGKDLIGMDKAQPEICLCVELEYVYGLRLTQIHEDFLHSDLLLCIILQNFICKLVKELSHLFELFFVFGWLSRLEKRLLHLLAESLPQREHSRME